MLLLVIDLLCIYLYY